MIDVVLCPICDGRGWVRPDSVPYEDYIAIKSVALSSMETAENLMDECTKRADEIKELRGVIDVLNNRIKYSYNRALDVFEEKELEIKELETGLGRMLAGERAADKEIERLRMKIFDIEGREDLVTTELEHRACAAEDQLRVAKEMRDEVLEDWETKRSDVVRLQTVVYGLESDIVCFKSAVKGFRAVVGEKDLRIAAMESHRDVIRTMHNRREEEFIEVVNDLVAESERDKLDIELLDEILKIVNPLIKSGDAAEYAKPGRLLAIQMHGLCQTVIQFRRKHNIVG